MKRTLFITTLIMLGAACTGCTPDRRTPIEKAYALLQARRIHAVIGLDSVKGYEDEHQMLMAAYNLQWHADSIRLHQLSQKRLITKKEKETVIEDANLVYKLKIEAAKKRMAHRLSNESETFIGYSVIMNDSTTGSTMTVYFDKDITKIESIDRKVSYE